MATGVCSVPGCSTLLQGGGGRWPEHSVARRGGPSMRLRAQVLRARPWCQRCGVAPAVEIHHIKPVEIGGTDELRNLLAVCVACHRELSR